MLSSLSLSAIPHIIVIVVVVCGPFVLRRLRPHCYLAGAMSPLGVVVCPHILVVIICGSFLLQRTHSHHCLVGVLSSLPHIVIVIVFCLSGGGLIVPPPHRHHCHSRATCPAKASSLPHVVVIIIVIPGTFVLQRPHCCRCLVGATTSLSVLLTILASLLLLLSSEHQQTRGGNAQSGTVCTSTIAATAAPARWGSGH